MFTSRALVVRKSVLLLVFSFTFSVIIRLHSSTSNPFSLATWFSLLLIFRRLDSSATGFSLRLDSHIFGDWMLTSQKNKQTTISELWNVRRPIRQRWLFFLFAQLLAKRAHTGRVQLGGNVPERGPLPHGSTHVVRHFFGVCNQPPRPRLHFGKIPKKN